MPSALQIYDPRERRLVALADLALTPLGWLARRGSTRPVQRVLLLRLERIGDLLMTLGAIGAVRQTWPGAEIDLAVGRWNHALAALVPGLSRIEPADAPWLARPGEIPNGWPALVRTTRRWRRRGYDLVINFEPDIRSNLVAWLTGAPRRVGYSSGGGRAFLTDARPYAADLHVSTNAHALVARAAGQSDRAVDQISYPALIPPPDARARARALLGSSARPWIGVHASGGRESKQWHLDRFAAVARALARERGATIVLTGSTADRPLIDHVRQALHDVPVVDAGGSLDLPALAALLEELDLVITGDTGPMHLASVMGTPVVALFGPSNPARYGPHASLERILRVDLPCSPCGQVRLPPERCRGHVPECLDRILVEDVVAAAREVLDGTTGNRFDR
jgi:lipopolysaccharide heptosyltransferase II